MWRRGPRADVDPLDIEVLLVHPGGPFWSKKDEHGWSIPKGEFDPATETALDAACREFFEELGCDVPDAPMAELVPFRAGKKKLHPFMVEGDFDAERVQPDDQHRSMVEIEWPPRSGNLQRFPEVDRAQWVPLTDAESKLHKGQGPLVALIVEERSRAQASTDESAS